MVAKIAKHVACGISGGVDSAVAALILKRKGYRVSGVFMRNWDTVDETGQCRTDRDLEDAEHVCKTIDIPLHQVNFVKDYWHEVFSDFLKQYQKGLTPNPDILCNKYIKFDKFFDYCVNHLEADAIATGHYARTSHGENFLKGISENQSSLAVGREGCRLLKAVDSWKDQTFFLSQISQRALEKAVFPLGDLTKDVVKQIATQSGLERIATKKESMGICFIGSRNFKNFITEYIEPKKGNFVSIEDYSVRGTHDGHFIYTVGQKARIQGSFVKWYVVDKNPQKNEVFVAPGSDHPALYHQTFITGPVHWVNKPPRRLVEEQMLDCWFRFQHVDPVVECTLTLAGMGSVIVSLKEPIKALTPGQYAVFYIGEECLGSGQILQVGPSEYAMNWKKYQSGELPWPHDHEGTVEPPPYKLSGKIKELNKILPKDFAWRRFFKDR